MEQALNLPEAARDLHAASEDYSHSFKHNIILDNDHLLKFLQAGFLSEAPKGQNIPTQVGPMQRASLERLSSV
jgi:hypothetical protein